MLNHLNAGKILQTRGWLAVPVAIALAAYSAFAQDEKVARTTQPKPIVTGTATAELLRIAAPSTVVQLRLEVYDDAGQKLFDTEQRGGNVLDWHLRGNSGERVADGSYLCVVTVKNLSGRFSQKIGHLTVNAQAATLRPAAVSELNLRQAQTVGPMESEDEGLAVMKVEEVQPVTVLSNSGDEAQLARTRGALSFRVGDFFSGNDPGRNARGGYERVAFVGQVVARVRGTVQAGDFIVASGLNDGTGIAVSPERITVEQFEQVAGQAWEASAAAGVKSVRIAVGLIRRDPTVRRLFESNRQAAAKIETLTTRLAALEGEIARTTAHNFVVRRNRRAATVAVVVRPLK